MQMTDSSTCLFSKETSNRVEKPTRTLFHLQPGSFYIQTCIAANDTLWSEEGPWQSTGFSPKKDPSQDIENSGHQPSPGNLPTAQSSQQTTEQKTPGCQHVVEDRPVAPAQGDATTEVRERKTLYKLLDESTGLYCQGGPWPCQWDDVGKAWSSIAALRRHLRTMLSRGYHLRPRLAPEHWNILEIEQITLETKRLTNPAGAIMCNR